MEALDALLTRVSVPRLHDPAPDAAQRAAWLARRGATLDGDRLTLPLPQPSQLAPLLAELAQQGVTPRQLQYGVSRLEEIYLGLLAGECDEGDTPGDGERPR